MTNQPVLPCRQQLFCRVMQIAQQQRLAVSRRQVASKQAAAFQPASVNDQRCISVPNIVLGTLAVAAGFGLHQLVASIQDAISGPSACRATAAVRNLPGNGKIQRCPVYAGLTTGDYFEGRLFPLLLQHNLRLIPIAWINKTQKFSCNCIEH